MLRVRKRNGELENVSYDKITKRLEAQRLGYTNVRALFNSSVDGHLKGRPTSPPLSNHVNCALVAQKVIAGIYDGVKTTELDTLASETAAYMSTIHPDYSELAARIAISNLHKETKSSFLEVVRDLRNYTNPVNNIYSPMIAEDVFDIICKNADLIESKIDYSRDFCYTYFGFKTLCRSYLLRINKHIVERPQHMLMRVSIGIHKEDLESAFLTYDLMSRQIMTHATPTLFNAGTPKPQMSSCFLLTMVEDSIDGIYETLMRCAKISKAAGGIGLNASGIRATGSYIAGTNGYSNGLCPFLRVFNATARCVDQGGGKRKGAFKIFIEPWHADFLEFLDLKNANGADELRARDLFYSVWMPSLLVKRVKEGGMWSLMCPAECPGLIDCYGEQFNQLYERYEREGKYRKQLPAVDVWNKIVDRIIEHGGPSIMFKDHCNEKSNQKNLGCIRGSNLCTEIIQYTSADEIATCNLASVSLKACVGYNSKGELFFDHESLFEVVKQMTKNLNRVIDVNHYPLEQSKKSNFDHRPIGLGVQGLADAFFMLRLPFESEEAAQLNKEIFETIYFAACTASNELAILNGPYKSFYGSPASKGLLQFDLWNVTPDSGRWNWDNLKKSIVTHGLRNSLLVAPMPTAGTSQILGNTECFEPIDSNITTRGNLAGTFLQVNSYLVKDLEELGMWDEVMQSKIKANNGSIQNIEGIPVFLKELYKTSKEIRQKCIIDLAAGRGPYVDQGQSMNLFFECEDSKSLKELPKKLNASLIYAHDKGLKNGIYYCRSNAAAVANTENSIVQKKNDMDVSFFGDMTYRGAPTENEKKQEAEANSNMVCTRKEGCFSCGS